MFIVYILRTSSNTLYTGQTNNLEKRLKEHRNKSSKSAKYIRYFNSFKLVYSEKYPTRKKAMQREAQLKRWSKAKKENIIAGNMKLELIQFPNINNFFLPGLLYEPENGSEKVLIYLHGNGSSGGFYSVELQNVFGKTLADNGISYFTFTNTGGHLIQKFDKITNGERERVVAGVAYELIKDCIGDIDGAINFVKSRGYKHIYLIGSSTGANKICIYDFYKKKNLVEKYVLESGGDDSGLYYNDVGNKKFRLALQKCREEIEKGKGRNLVPNYLYDSPISYQSLYDQINPDGDYNVFPFYWQLNGTKIMKKEPWREIKKIVKPTLVIYGDKDEYCYGKVQDCVESIKNAVVGRKNFCFEIIQSADHSYFGKSKELAEKVVSFLDA